MNSKILLLSFAVISVGLFALPQTMSLFSGQHTWYDKESVNCRKCHEDIYEEITSPSNQVHTDSGMIECEQCHKTTSLGNIGANNTYGQWRVYNGTIDSNASTDLKGAVNTTAHAAITVECLACHGIGNTVSGEEKGLTGVAVELQGSSEAHRSFYYAAVSNKSVGDVNYESLKSANIITGAPLWYDTSKPNQTVVQLKGTNAACIGCHTHAVVNITWRRSIGYEMTVNATNAGWDVDFVGVSASTNTTTTSSE